ncbi:MAG: sulfite exporter TauE/SafE family protein [Melioribacteraceae bacterium]
MDFILILIASIIVSGFGTIVGFGGGVFMVPILVIVFGFPVKVAIGAVIISLIPATTISNIFNFRNSTIDPYTAIALGIPTVLGTILGAYLTKIFPLILVEIIFALVIFLIGIYTILRGKVNKRDRNKNSFLYKANNIGFSIIRKTPYGAYKLNYFLSTFFGIFSGLIAGFLGIGGGFLQVPVMINIFNIPILVAVSTSLFLIFFTSITGSISHYFLGNINFSNSIPVLIGFPIGAIIGNLLNVKLKEITLKILVGGGLILASISVLINLIL